MMNRTLDERVARLLPLAVEVRQHIITMVHTARSGHIGGALSAADIVTALYFDIMNIDPARPDWPDRDRFILSKGHACPVQYACLAMRGYFAMEHLARLRKFESILQGHPIRKTPGIDMNSGSLGQGISFGVGMALEARMLRRDCRVFTMLGDGEVNEGQVWEAAAAAAKFRLDNLVAIIDRNGLQMDGYTRDIMPMDPLDAKFEAFGWRTIMIDGHDIPRVLGALDEATRPVDGRPVCIIARTVKGKGVRFMEDMREWHGKVPTEEQHHAALCELGRTL